MPDPAQPRVRPRISAGTQRLRFAGGVALLATAYVATGRLGLQFASVGSEITLVWPPAGIALGSLLLFGVRYWPGVFVGAAIVNLTVGGSPTLALAIAAGNTLQALLAAVVLDRPCGFRRRFERPKDLFWFLIVAVAGGPALSATAGSLSLTLLGSLAWDQVAVAWGTWWLGDGAGVLVVTPLMLAWMTRSRRARAPGVAWAEPVAIALAFAAVPLAIRVMPWTSSRDEVLVLLLFPLLVWSAMRFGIVGAATASFATASVAVWTVMTPGGLFTSERLADRLVMTWGMIAVGVSSSLLMAILSERDRAARERRRSERAARESEARFRAIFEQVSDSILVVDPDTGRIEEFNDAAHRTLGYTREEFATLNIQDIESIEDTAAVREHLRRIVETGFEEFESQARTKAGDTRPVVVRARAIRLDRQRRVVCVVRDLTDAKRAADREAIFGRLIDQTRNEVYVLDGRSYRFLIVNSGARENLGYSMDELRGMTPLDLVPGDLAPSIAERLMKEPSRAGARVIEAMHRRKDGSHYPVEVHVDELRLDGAPVLVAVAVDLTERKLEEQRRAAMERHLQESQKLESLGVLAGGIAHDFNNLLVGIMGNAGLALEDVPADSPARQSLEEIDVASHRAADLCRQMLAYSGRGRFEVRALDLSALVREMKQLVASSVSKAVRFECRLGDALPAVEADATQLRQVVMNLITNAADAMMPGGGTVRLDTTLIDLDRTFLERAELGPALEPGPYVVLSVIDAGTGMDEDARRRMFEPFFTAKEGGRGLGLAAVLGIIRGHGGAIRVDTAPGKGTRIDVILPPGAREAAPEPVPEIGGESAGRPGTVLVVDDEPVVLDLARRALERSGFVVLTASDGREAVDLVRGDPRCADCVVIDLSMPVLGGVAAFERLRAIRPDLPVILSSGYDRSEMTRSHGDRGFSGFLSKPYSPRDLVRRVRDAMRPVAVTA